MQQPFPDPAAEAEAPAATLNEGEVAASPPSPPEMPEAPEISEPAAADAASRGPSPAEMPPQAETPSPAAASPPSNRASTLRQRMSDLRKKAQAIREASFAAETPATPEPESFRPASPPEPQAPQKPELPRATESPQPAAEEQASSPDVLASPQSAPSELPDPATDSPFTGFTSGKTRRERPLRKRMIFPATPDDWDEADTDA